MCGSRAAATIAVLLVPGWSVASEAGHDSARSDSASVLHGSFDRSASSQPSYNLPPIAIPTASAGFCVGTAPTEPSKLQIDDLDAPLVGAFLDHLENQRQNGVRQAADLNLLAG
jgi:hypothetical protein